MPMNIGGEGIMVSLSALSRITVFYLSLLLLSGCGGGGGSDNDNVSLLIPSQINGAYRGDQNLAVLNQNNAMSFVGSFFGRSINQIDSRQGLNKTKKENRLDTTWINIRNQIINVATSDIAIESHQYSRRKIDTTDGCRRIVGNLDSNNQGTVNMVMSNCSENGVTINGNIVMKITEFDVSQDEAIEYSLSFNGLTFQLLGKTSVVMGLITFKRNEDRSTITVSDLRYKDSDGVETYVQNLVDTYKDNGFGFKHELTGKLYLDGQGYVEVSTPENVTFDFFINQFIQSGKIIFTAGSGTKLLILPEDAFFVRKIFINLDEDGDGSFESATSQSETDDWNSEKTFSENPPPRLSISTMPSVAGRELNEMRVNEELDIFAFTSFEVDTKWFLSSAPAESSLTIPAVNNNGLTITFDKIGDYVITIEATDSVGMKTVKQVNITVIGNQAPIANISLNNNQVINVGTRIGLNSLDSIDSDEVNYHEYTVEWTLIVKPENSTSTLDIGTGALREFADFTPDISGEYTIKLSLTDSDGAIGTTERTIVVP